MHLTPVLPPPRGRAAAVWQRDNVEVGKWHTQRGGQPCPFRIRVVRNILASGRRQTGTHDSKNRPVLPGVTSPLGGDLGRAGLPVPVLSAVCPRRGCYALMAGQDVHSAAFRRSVE
jgi:hypothetical protein